MLDCVREIRPRFSPDAATAELAQVCQSYGIQKVVGDRYAGDWPGERWREYEISYEASEKDKSAIYREVLPLINAKRCELLDSPRLKQQLRPTLSTIGISSLASPSSTPLGYAPWLT